MDGGREDFMTSRDVFLMLLDQAFPWPAGKAPWLIKNGGTGVVPEGALERFGMSGGFRQISMEEEESGQNDVYQTLSAVDNVPAPRNIQVYQYLY